MGGGGDRLGDERVWWQREGKLLRKKGGTDRVLLWLRHILLIGEKKQSSHGKEGRT